MTFIMSSLIISSCSNIINASTNTSKSVTLDSTNGISLNIESYQGFSIDNVIDSEYGKIHYNIYIPQHYDNAKQYALYITLPGYEGLYRFGVAANLKSEKFAFEAQIYNENMIIVAPQLNDWGETSARQTIALTHFLLNHFNIDKTHVFINGYSGGGETLSLILTYQPDLFVAALHVASVWDGNFTNVIKARTPIYFVIRK